MTSWITHRWGYLQLLIHSDKPEWPSLLPNLPFKEDWFQHPAVCGCILDLSSSRGTFHTSSICDLLYFFFTVNCEIGKKTKCIDYIEQLIKAELLSTECRLSKQLKWPAAVCTCSSACMYNVRHTHTQTNEESYCKTLFSIWV